MSGSVFAFHSTVAPARKSGRGLKPTAPLLDEPLERSARSKERARIETSTCG